MPAKRITISPEISMAELFKQWPQLIPLFLSRQMSCVGCSMAAFDSLQDAADNYQIPIDGFIQELVLVIQPRPE